ncbi:enoyl-CoA hydratase [Undibacterium oligocarboniphilum]|uniref:Enoyl-CoA hydratase n=1 Tax=Undibacterium oligocarboniphilum TaxID=666702 RepID=A0A850QMK7_9BURK|nr:enoyl-CoA hydratase [Undibacterium oligocarboniphilum]MBC3870576.1 enoyl-CoA hydratase [Undibacterium oligocarboniphilum]NVO78623.1 enoyl-CoA hydratase [Undibacterium oligocarboniphilum]
MDILTHKENGILTISFNRPEKKNAITQAMYQAMADALRAAENDTAVRAILLTGKPEIFTAGNDLEDFMKNAGGLANPDAVPPVYQFMRALNEAEKPVIAAVSGAAVGIGTTLLMHCDLIYLADNARLSMPFTQLGLCPEFASSMIFQQIVGYQRAAEKLMLGEAFSAQEAYDMGFVNKVLPLDELLPYAQQVATKLVTLPAASIRVTKRLMKANRPAAVSDKMLEENQHFSVMLNAPEAKEAFMAFFQKRKPDFSQFH